MRWSSNHTKNDNSMVIERYWISTWYPHHWIRIELPFVTMSIYQSTCWIVDIVVFIGLRIYVYLEYYKYCTPGCEFMVLIGYSFKTMWLYNTICLLFTHGSAYMIDRFPEFPFNRSGKFYSYNWTANLVKKIYGNLPTIYIITELNL